MANRVAHGCASERYNHMSIRCLDIVATQGACLAPRGHTPIYTKRDDETFAAQLSLKLRALLIAQACRQIKYGAEAAEEWPIGRTPPEMVEKRKAELDKLEELSDNAFDTPPPDYTPSSVSTDPTPPDVCETPEKPAVEAGEQDTSERDRTSHRVHKDCKIRPDKSPIYSDRSGIQATVLQPPPPISAHDAPLQSSRAGKRQREFDAGDEAEGYPTKVRVVTAHSLDSHRWPARLRPRRHGLIT
ncbi:hypothetical protein F5Y03DRAFT_202655 [Xylaria venustula]|nr:hypothetical protein F5Y03DRAFT_202655 [Xylaria venustula]